MHRHHGVKEIGQLDTLGLQGQLEFFRRGVKPPGATGFSQGDSRFIRTKEHPFTQPAVTIPVYGIDGMLAQSLH